MGATSKRFGKRRSPAHSSFPVRITDVIPADRRGSGWSRHSRPSDFSAFLRFYKVKPLYLGSIWVLHRLFHAGGFMACRLVSSISYLLLGLILALWLGEHLPVPLACLCAFLIASLPQVIDLGRYLLPDALSAALLLAVIYAVLYRTPNLGLQLGLLALVPLSRPDDLIFCALFGALLLGRATPVPRKRMWRLTAFAAACTGYGALLRKATGALPYKALFIHSFLDFSAPPSSF